MDKKKNSNETIVTTLSLLMVGIVSAAIVMLMMQDDPGKTGASITLEALQGSSVAQLPPPPVNNAMSSVEIAIPALQTPVPQVAAPQTEEAKRMAEITTRFEQAVVMLHARQYEHAATALHRVMTLAPRMPEVYVNMGYAKLGQALPNEALVFFETATQLKPEQANAYWGMAVALENSGDLAGALGAMRTFLHLSSGDDNFARRARSALWEWEEALARGPLPEEEKEFLERGALQWESRNTPRDDADSGEQTLQVQPLQ
ncbi:MAG: tetratricopeptide repeat protein [Gammaproteobacteria bacterium]|nr:tetratricopeptide repeat protein [Gammaproteobacteria bacterium]